MYEGLDFNYVYIEIYPSDNEFYFAYQFKSRKKLKFNKNGEFRTITH